VFFMPGRSSSERRVSLAVAVIIDFDILAQQCAPTVAVQTITQVVMHESRMKPYAIGVNGGARISRQPLNRVEAIDTAKKLIDMGLSIDMGLAQINSANLRRLGLTVEQVFDPCTNLRAAETILRGCYDPAAKRHGSGQVALQAALSCYNTGNYTRGFTNGYVASVYRTSKAKE
jgi:type IV secretion system protein VirB1